ncbi:tRNA1(Val) (adenine(37)-N6)-methyltransferase [Companilactobacillus pabuli]|jgi:tRNA1(Val) A37 N6-methylase TrmN6|uniref:tRNA1(Val) (Adenine(37)-N6)-methyltransferase n=1 Tax=Companilactobacillus pabuli TaxID=2714036 RepID=A0A7L7KWV7_9LACO|nr:tRNA1(Val) (adenine(37)-N6)-methyltransferase [Companilactobacillus pabuli]AKP03728.1 methyltransferase [Companilactobacillus farciminis]AKS52033.1 methyltransferase [Companilactobacillus farciminis]MDG5112942.1 tRNA1(Val) (adenine(37)-N6)-methyltransferase [Companilactobacillus pabuli]QMT84287.1 tRNA1(Val) (adenine(37)-N6)-methyltransferase [Companilactobacillus pabuli]
MSINSQDTIANSGVKINQDKELYSFNLDTILLYNFANPAKKGKVVDLCAGNGAIGLSLTSKTSAKIYLVEIQKKLSDLAQQSIIDNHLSKQVTLINDDLKNVQQYIAHDTVDTVVCNPPYFKVTDQTAIKDNSVLAIARHELKANLKDILSAIKVLLKENSHAYLVYRPQRLSDLLVTMAEEKLQAKRLRFVRTTANKDANLVLVDAIKTVKTASLRVEPDLVIYDENHQLSKEANLIINGK